MVRLAASVEPEEMVVVTNQKTREEVLCRVVSVKAYPNVKSQVEVEFTQRAPRFWGVNFPPEDWNPAERKRPEKRAGSDAPAETQVPSPVET